MNKWIILLDIQSELLDIIKVFNQLQVSAELIYKPFEIRKKQTWFTTSFGFLSTANHLDDEFHFLRKKSGWPTISNLNSRTEKNWEQFYDLFRKKKLLTTEPFLYPSWKGFYLRPFKTQGFHRQLQEFLKNYTTSNKAMMVHETFWVHDNCLMII